MAQSFHSLWLKSALLAFESQQVIALRMMRLAGGGVAADREMQRMGREKIEAGAKLGFDWANAVALGKGDAVIAGAAIRSLRAHVRRNRRRLTRV